jgi:hypothetical protein
MKKKIIWRLSKLPTPDEIRELVKDKIITQEEAREILLSESDIDERDKKSLEEEIKFLRQIVEKTTSRNTIVETIKYIEKYYYSNPWFATYTSWCSGTYTQGTTSNLAMSGSSSDLITTGFSGITTF